MPNNEATKIIAELYQYLCLTDEGFREDIDAILKDSNDDINLKCNDKLDIKEPLGKIESN